MKRDSGFSGLEAAIVLIAFVVVAAVFSYVMLGAGFFATQKSQEVTYSGIKQATSNVFIDGQIYGTMSAVGGTSKLVNIQFTLAIPEGGQPQSLDEDALKFLFASSNLDPYDVLYDNRVLDEGDDPLMPGKKATFTLRMYKDESAATHEGPALGESFTLEVKPLVGASSLVTKTLSTGYEGGPII